MRTICEIPEMVFPIKLEQRANAKFRVTYGYQVDDHLDYTLACQTLGAAILHALVCEGRVALEE